MQRCIAAVLVGFFAVGATAQTTTSDHAYLKKVQAAVKAADPTGKYEGKLWSYTTGNKLDENWLRQTPAVWGLHAVQVRPYDHGGNYLAQDLYDLISQAKATVDISTLYPAPDGLFSGKIVAGLKQAIANGHHLTVRLLVGHYTSNFDANAYLFSMRDQIGDAGPGGVTFYAAGMKTNAKSWNHSKIVSVDGRVALVGGHNLWPVDVLGPRPVHDLSMKVRGPAAAAADRYLDVLWSNVCDWNGKGLNPIYSRRLVSGEHGLTPTCLRTMPLPDPPTPAPGTIDVLGVGRSAAGLVADSGDLINPSDPAMVAAFDAATTSIKISQQDLIVTGVWPAGFHAIGRALARNVPVQIVLTNQGAKAGEGGLLPYSTNATLAAVNVAMRQYLTTQAKLSTPEVAQRMRNFRVVGLRFGPDAQWDKFPFANHAKMILIDDRLFYIGSSNLYPSDLQEYGYFIDDASAAQTLLTQYWNPMWKWSSK